MRTLKVLVELYATRKVVTDLLLNGGSTLLFDLGIEKKYSAKLCVSNLVQRFLYITNAYAQTAIRFSI